MSQSHAESYERYTLEGPGTLIRFIDDTWVISGPLRLGDAQEITPSLIPVKASQSEVLAVLDRIPAPPGARPGGRSADERELMEALDKALPELADARDALFPHADASVEFIKNSYE